MKIVRICGGLGNQMFQYAFSRAITAVEKKISTMNDDVYLDISCYNQIAIRDGINLVHNGFELERIFSLPYKIASDESIKKLSSQPTSLFNRFKRKYFTKNTHYIDKTFSFHHELFELKSISQKNMYYDGYWQSEKYFKNIEDEIRKIYTFKKDLDQRNTELIKSLKPSQTASIHIRRGDYLNSENLNVCTETYYKNAIKKLYELSKPTYILVFSDDIPWCKNVLQLEKYINTSLCIENITIIYVDWNIKQNSWQDMALMNQCTFNIIANSSFSWWGAWLNSCQNKIVIAPKIWNMREIQCKDKYYHHNYTDIIPDTWIRVDIN